VSPVEKNIHPREHVKITSSESADRICVLLQAALSGERAKEIDAWKNPARRVAFYSKRRKFERSPETRKREVRNRTSPRFTHGSRQRRKLVLVLRRDLRLTRIALRLPSRDPIESEKQINRGSSALDHRTSRSDRCRGIREIESFERSTNSSYEFINPRRVKAYYSAISLAISA